jgi:hypothetical protein
MNKTTYEQELEQKGILIYTTVGMSMRPFLRSGEDMVIIERRDNSRFRPRDVVLYRRKSGKYVLHRIMAVRKDDYVLCGDNCWDLEFGIRDNQILGILTGVIRNGTKTDVNAPGYRRRVFAWWLLYPIRACLFYIRYLVGKLWARIKKSAF